MESGSSEDVIRNWASVQETLGGAKKRAMRALINEYMSLLREPAEGFVVKVEDPFNWDVGIYGPPSTPYWGGYFKLHVSFPDEYPFEPPKLTFRSRFWHPNVYQNGVVCMSILHDPQSEDVPSDLPTEEKWNPTLSVRTVLLSLISIIGTPNPDSPANVDATKMYRSWIEGEDDSYYQIIQDIVARSKRVAERDGVRIPKTLEEYLRKPDPELHSLIDYQDVDSDSDDSSYALSSPSLSGSDCEEYMEAISFREVAAESERPIKDLMACDCETNEASTSKGKELSSYQESSLYDVNGYDQRYEPASSHADLDNNPAAPASSSNCNDSNATSGSSVQTPVSCEQSTTSCNSRKRRTPLLFLFHKSDSKKRRKQ